MKSYIGMFRSALLTVVLTALFAPVQAYATTLPLPVSLGTYVEHEFFPGFAEDRIDAITTSFTADLGSFDTITANLAAPSGQEIFVGLPAGITGEIDFILNFSAGTSFWGDEDWPAMAAFTGLVGGGTLTLDESWHFGRGGGNQVFLQFRYSFTAPFAFTGWQVEAYGPFTSGGTLTFQPDSRDNAIVARYMMDYGVDDPGQLVSFQDATPVPEPATMLLFGTGLAGFVGSRLRRKKK